MNWLTPELKQRIRDIFGPRYGRALSEQEVTVIAENLTGVMEGVLKFKWREKYGNRYS